MWSTLLSNGNTTARVGQKFRLGGEFGATKKEHLSGFFQELIVRVGYGTLILTVNVP